MTWREKKAGECLDEGNYEGALAILRDSERERELEQAIKLERNAVERILDYVSENSLRIKTLETMGENEDMVQEIKKCYEENIRLYLLEESLQVIAQKIMKKHWPIL